MIFISHARKDKPVIDLFVEKILRLGFAINPDHIFYTSHPDTDIPGGEYINGTIFDHINSSELIIIFMSKHYFNSAYCLCEMGASRLLHKNKKVFLFLFPNLNYAEVEGVFSENMIKKFDKEGVDSFIDVVNVACSKEKITNSRTAPNRHASLFLSSFQTAMDEIIPPIRVSMDEYNRVKKQCDDYEIELNKTEEKLKDLNEYVARLEPLKDADAVESVKPKNSRTVEDVADTLISSIQNELSSLTGDGRFALFYFFRYGEDVANRRISKEHLDISYDLDNLFFELSGDTITLGERSDSIMSSIRTLSTFLAGDSLESLCATYGFNEDDWHAFRESLPSAPIEDLSYWRTNLF